MADAKPMGGGQYIKGEGKFTLTTKKLFVNNGHKGRFFIAEFEVVESTSASDPVGASRSWAVPLTGERAARSFGEIKNLVFALTGKDPRDCGDPSSDPKLHKEATELVMAACDPTFAAKNKIDPTELLGLQVGLETNAKPIKSKPGQNFTVHTWSPIA